MGKILDAVLQLLFFWGSMRVRVRSLSCGFLGSPVPSKGIPGSVRSVMSPKRRAITMPYLISSLAGKYSILHHSLTTGGGIYIINSYSLIVPPSTSLVDFPDCIERASAIRSYLSPV